MTESELKPSLVLQLSHCYICHRLEESVNRTEIVSIDFQDILNNFNSIARTALHDDRHIHRCTFDRPSNPLSGADASRTKNINNVRGAHPTKYQGARCALYQLLLIVC